MDQPNFDWGEEFDDFLSSLNETDEAILLEMIERIERFGLQDSIKKKRVKKVEKNLYEIRVHTPGKIIRSFYFQLVENKYYILNSFVKKSQKTPRQEIDKAVRIRERISKEINDKKKE